MIHPIRLAAADHCFTEMVEISNSPMPWQGLPLDHKWVDTVSQQTKRLLSLMSFSVNDVILSE